MERKSQMPRILVVDDEEGIRELLETVLRRRGHDVLLADSGRKALDVFRRERPQVTILELTMPEMDGFAVLKQIRSVDPRAQVMILTGTGTSTEEQRARELGVTDFLQKGFSLQALGAAMDRVLSYVGSPTDSIATKPTEEPRRMEDRRKFPRFWVQFPISLLKEGVIIAEGTIYDLSAGGCAVESQANVLKGDYVGLQLYLADHQGSTTPLKVDVAAVRWAIQQKFGLEFISMPSGDQERLRRHIKTLQTTSR